MCKCTIAFLRNATPSLQSGAFPKRGPPPLLSFYSLASTPDAAQVGACSAPKISLGILETRKATVRKARELKAAKIGCGSLHAEVSSSKAVKARPSSAKSNRKAKSEAKSREIEVFKAEDVFVVAGDPATQNAEAEEPALHAQSACVESKAAQNAATIDRSDETEFNSKKNMINTKEDSELNGIQSTITAEEEFDLSANVTMMNANENMTIAAIDRSEEMELNENENMINVKEELAEWTAKLDVNTSRQWMGTANKLLDYGIPPAHVKKMLTKCRTLSHTHCVDSTLKHFSMLGMSHEEIGCVISRMPTILQMSDSLFQSKVEFFESVGIDRRSLGKRMKRAYRSLALSPSTLRKRSEFWENYLEGVQKNAFCTLILRNPVILSSNLRTVKQTIAYLEELGLSKLVLLGAPSILTCSVNVLEMRLKALDQFGLSNSARTLATLHGISRLKLQERLHNLVALGFSFQQVQNAVMAYPFLLRIREEKIRVKLSYAVNVMKVSLDMLLVYPAFWGYSYEKRIKYRYEVLQALKSLGAYTKNISLGYMLSMPEAKFSKNFVGKLHAATKHPSE